MTPLSCGNVPGSNRKDDPERPAGARYTTDSYRRAIARACDQAFPLRGTMVESHKAHRWHPHQLRHNAATDLRKEFGLEAARIILGHRSAAITEVYAEKDERQAMEAMMRVG